MRRLLPLLLGLSALGLLAPTRCNPPPGALRQVVVHRPGFVEVHTPGSGAPEEHAPTAAVTDLLGADVDLNTVTTVRTSFDNGSGAPPRAVLILIPGFLGGATTFDPIARDLVRKFDGSIEVWAVDRRPNQLEDRLGAQHAVSGATSPACMASPPTPDCAIFVGAQFYSADLDVDPLGDFPGPGDLDLDLDGVLDPQGTLTDGFGATRGPIVLAQDDARFMAWWGLDTYFRDWKLLVEEARALVGETGLVLLGGHSQGTTWSSTFAAYDFDPDPAVVDAGYESIDGLILLEGGGVGPGSDTKPTRIQYVVNVNWLGTAGGPPVFLEDFSGIPLQDLGTAGEVSAIAGFFQPDEPALVQRTPTFGSGVVELLLGAPASNRAVVGLFLDDDFSPISAFRASIGFSDDADNAYAVLAGFAPFYLAAAKPGGLRTWKDFDDPTLPTCPPGVEDVSPGCAILDNGPPSDPGDPPRANGVEAEVTSIDDFLKTQFGKANGFEWYFVSGRVSLDFGYGNDSSGLVAENLALNPSHEGPLVITQNANVDVPVLAIGGSNGLTPEVKSFSRYFDSIATPPSDRRAVILEGYAHLDPINARDNLAVPEIVDFVNELLQRRLLESF